MSTTDTHTPWTFRNLRIASTATASDDALAEAYSAEADLERTLRDLAAEMRRLADDLQRNAERVTETMSSNSILSHVPVNTLGVVQSQGQRIDLLCATLDVQRTYANRTRRRLLATGDFTETD